MGIHNNNNLINTQPNQYYFSQFPDINDYKMVSLEERTPRLYLPTELKDLGLHSMYLREK